MSAFDRLSFRAATAIVALAAFILLTAPTLIVVVSSLTSAESLKFPPPGYSLRWYFELLNSDDLLRMARRSLIVALCAAALAGSLGGLAAIGVYRSTSRAARLLDALFMSPLIVPWIAIGLGILLTLSLVGAPPSLTTLVAGHAVVGAPFALRTTMASLSALDPALLEASTSLGAGAFYGFRRVMLPAIAPGVAAGAFLAFVASFDNVPISLFLADARSQMLPIRLWQMIQADLDPRVASISTALVALTLLLMLAMERLVGFSRQMAR